MVEDSVREVGALQVIGGLHFREAVDGARELEAAAFRIELFRRRGCGYHQLAAVLVERVDEVHEAPGPQLRRAHDRHLLQHQGAEVGGERQIVACPQRLLAELGEGEAGDPAAAADVKPTALTVRLAGATPAPRQGREGRPAKRLASGPSG